MNYQRLYSTKELEEHIKKLYERTESVTKKDAVFEPLRTYFSTTKNVDGNYCFSDDDEYNFYSVERGVINLEKKTKSLLEITYLVLESQIFWMAVQYERKHRIENQDSRRIIFSKELQYFNTIGSEYEKLAELEISEILKKNPYHD